MTFDLDAYVTRLGHRGPLDDSERTLIDLHRAQVFAIPFENVGIQLGQPVSLAPDDVFDKLVRHRRGGYCFELNGLFAQALDHLGFRYRLHCGRVWSGSDGVPAPTHQCMVVSCGGREWLCDVGFGGHGALQPIPLEYGRDDSQDYECYRLRRDGEHGTFVSRRNPGGGWEDLYSFSDQPSWPVDFRAPSWYLSTSPHSRFVQILVCVRTGRASRTTLTETVLRVRDGSGVVAEEQVDRHERLAEVLEETFGLPLPAGARLRGWEQRRAQGRGAVL